jgi:hypothetical protein
VEKKLSIESRFLFFFLSFLFFIPRHFTAPSFFLSFPPLTSPLLRTHINLVCDFLQANPADPLHSTPLHSTHLTSTPTSIQPNTYLQQALPKKYRSAMGVFGEKHTSLTREQKRQLIYQADTQKLRPTEVCAWVMATWGLRIARVTVYSILHKQRASLMEGYTQESIAAAAATVASLQPNSTSKAATASKSKARVSKVTRKNQDGHASAATGSTTSKKQGAMLYSASGEQQQGRIHENKYRTSASSGESNSQKRRRSASVTSDRSMSSSGSFANHEGKPYRHIHTHIGHPVFNSVACFSTQSSLPSVLCFCEFPAMFLFHSRPASLCTHTAHGTRAKQANTQAHHNTIKKSKTKSK